MRETLLVSMTALVLVVSGCSQKNHGAVHYAAPANKTEKDKLTAGKAYVAKDGRTYNPVPKGARGPAPAEGNKALYDARKPYMAKNGKFYYFVEDAHREMGIVTKTAKSDSKPKPSSKKVLPPTPEERKQVVAEILGHKVTVGDLYDKIMRRPPGWRRAYTSKKAKKRFLEQTFVREYVLYEEAKKSHLENDPRVKNEVRRRMVDVLRQEKLKELRNSIKVSEEEMKKYYDDNKIMFVQPETIIAAHIVVKSKSVAEKILAELKKVKGEPPSVQADTWRKMVRKYSIDKETVKRGGLLGDSRMRGVAKDDARYPKELVAAIWAIEKSGEIGGPVKSKIGWHVVKRYARRKPLNIPYDKAKGRIRRLVMRDRLNKAYRQWLDSLKKKYGVKMHPENFDKVEIKVDKPKKR